jgi:hypothetical protein
LIVHDISLETARDGHYRNPASPDMIHCPPPWETSATPTLSSTNLSQNQRSQMSDTTPLVRTAPSVNSPTRARSTGDLLSEHEHSKLQETGMQTESSDGPKPQHDPKRNSLQRSGPTLVDIVNSAREAHDEKKDDKKET